MKKNTIFILVMAMLTVASSAMADFTVKITIEDDILENRRVWAKPLAEFVVEGNELKPEHFDEHLFDVMKRGFTKERTARSPFRVDVSFVTDGEFSVSSNLSNVRHLFSALTKKKSTGDSLWYSANSGPWTEVKWVDDARVKNIVRDGVDKQANVFHPGGRVDLRFYTSPNTSALLLGGVKPFFFRIHTRGEVLPVKMEEDSSGYKNSTSSIAPQDSYTHGYSESIQILRRWPDSTSAMPDVEEEYAQRVTANTPLVIRSSITAKDARPAAHVVKFGLKIDKPGVVQLGFIPHVSDSRLTDNIMPWGRHSKTMRPDGDDLFFTAEMDGQYIPLKSWNVGTDHWTSFYAKEPGIYSLAIYSPLTFIYMHTSNVVEPAGKMVSTDGFVVFKGPGEGKFRLVDKNDVVQVNSSTLRADGLYIGNMPIDDVLPR